MLRRARAAMRGEAQASPGEDKCGQMEAQLRVKRRLVHLTKHGVISAEVEGLPARSSRQVVAHSGAKEHIHTGSRYG